MFSLRKGFTLVEILIVLALIGLFVAATSYLTHDSRIAQKNAERLADTINTTFRTARSNMVLGKGVMSGSTLTTTDKRVISIGPTGIATTYGTTNTGTESNLPYPFYDNDTNYKITDISVSSGILVNGHMPNWDQTGVTAADIAILKDGTIEISSPDLMPTTKVNVIRITAGYEGFEQSVMIDRIMGRSEVVQGKGESTFIIPPPTPVHGVCNNTTYESCITGTASGATPGSCGGLSSWSCVGAYGGGNVGCSKINDPCLCTGSVPSSNVAKSNETGLTVDTPWQSTVPTGKCYYACTGGFTGANCDVPASINPSNLILSHTANNKIFTFSWTAGSGNGGSCKLQYYKNGTTWTDINPITYNCDSTLANQSVTLPADGWNSIIWNNISVRTIRTSDSVVVGTFPQNLTCSNITGSASFTPNIDENCNGNWDDYLSPSHTSPLPTTALVAYACPIGSYGGYTIAGIVSARWYNYSDWKFYSGGSNCTAYMSTGGYGQLESAWHGNSGIVPASPVGCTPTIGGYEAVMVSMNWKGGYCIFQVDTYN